MFPDNSLPRLITNHSKQGKSKPARNRRRAKDLAEAKLREIKRDFTQSRNSLEVAQDHLLPRSEAVDAILIQQDEAIYSVRQELQALRREMGIAVSSGPYLLSRRMA